jgi:hypothetical protein
MIKNIGEFLKEKTENPELDPFGEENWGPLKKYKIIKTVVETRNVEYVAYVDAESREDAKEKANYVYDWEFDDSDYIDSETINITVIEYE